MLHDVVDFRRLCLAKWTDGESDAIGPSSQDGVSISRNCESNQDNHVGQNSRCPSTCMSTGDLDSGTYLSVIQRLQERVSNLQSALLAATSAVEVQPDVKESNPENKSSEGHKTCRLRAEWSLAKEANSNLQSLQDISSRFIPDHFRSWSDTDVLSLSTDAIGAMGPLHPSRTAPTTSDPVSDCPPMEPVIFIDLTSAMARGRAERRPSPPPCACAETRERLRASEAEVSRLSAALAAGEEALLELRDGAARLRGERDAAAARAEAEARQWDAKERELRRLRLLMRFSELKRDSDRLGAVAARVEELEAERERLLAEHCKCRAELAECRRRLDGAPPAGGVGDGAVEKAVAPTEPCRPTSATTRHARPPLARGRKKGKSATPRRGSSKGHPSGFAASRPSSRNSDNSRNQSEALQFLDGSIRSRKQRFQTPGTQAW